MYKLASCGPIKPLWQIGGSFFNAPYHNRFNPTTLARITRMNITHGRAYVHMTHHFLTPSLP
jgi:hypothetical protein